MKVQRIYNTLTKQTEVFEPRDPGQVSIYACGLTPQAPAHLGHMRGAVLFDVIRRWFEYQGYTVHFVQNFTDIDDKIIRRSQEEGLPPSEVAKKYAQQYLDDLAALGVQPAKWVYVTENMDAIIEMIQRIIDRGHAYVVDGDVYFRVTSLPDYGKLSNRTLENMQAGARIEVDERKENPMDFALWKAAKPGEPAWESPWGPGRPGWHIECSALSLKELGPNFDIHAGGTDLIFPHHENEIAQAEAYLGEPKFARYWMHWGAVRLAGDKMSKSVGNVFAAREAITRYGAAAVRLFLLSTGYRSPIEFSEERLSQSQAVVSRLQNALARGRRAAGEETAEPAQEYITKFEDAMLNDFNTPSGIAALHECVGEMNDLLGTESPEPTRVASLLAAAKKICDLLGLPSEEEFSEPGLVEEIMAKVLKWRQMLREQKQYALADQIRDDLAELGIVLEDGVSGTTWRRT
ncbi:MAG: cysteine--tRNA ligase [Fimbriimonadales bacterium]|nr:MAG: cysteine--tRNA ligase [Fimbriimonadales bacterium]